MTPLDYSEDGWVNPATPGLRQARCKGRLCIADGLPGRLVVAITLTAEGLCSQCARTPAGEDQQRLRGHDMSEPLNKEALETAVTAFAAHSTTGRQNDDHYRGMIAPRMESAITAYFDSLAEQGPKPATEDAAA